MIKEAGQFLNTFHLISSSYAAGHRGKNRNWLCKPTRIQLKLSAVNLNDMTYKNYMNGIKLKNFSHSYTYFY